MSIYHPLILFIDSTSFKPLPFYYPIPIPISSPCCLRHFQWRFGNQLSRMDEGVKERMQMFDTCGAENFQPEGLKAIELFRPILSSCINNFLILIFAQELSYFTFTFRSTRVQISGVSKSMSVSCLLFTSGSIMFKSKSLIRIRCYRRSPCTRCL